VFYFIEAVEDAARELGLPVQIAHQLVLNTFTGAAKLASTSPDPVAVLPERVTSKGGNDRRSSMGLPSMFGAPRQLVCQPVIRTLAERYIYHYAIPRCWPGSQFVLLFF